MAPRHKETHLVNRIGWLRAAVLGANDGIISTASLIVGVAAAATSASEVLVAGVAGLIAGAMSMAAGEYARSVRRPIPRTPISSASARSSPRTPKFETAELAQIYMGRGVEPALARQVAIQLMAKDALGAHARDELGISEVVAARPIQAALTSAATFASGAALPLIAAILAPHAILAPTVFAVSLILLAALGALGAKVGGAEILRPTLRVAFWGALAMAVTAGIGALIGRAV